MSDTYASIITGVFISLVVLLGVLMISIYNSLITRNEAIKTNWTVLDGHLKRRLNLITALTTILKCYPLEELDALTKLINLDNIEPSATVGQRSIQESKVSLALRNVIAEATNNDEVNHDEKFSRLKQEISQIEYGLQRARRAYNRLVVDHNTSIKCFPQIIIASWYDLSEASLFEGDDEFIEQKNAI
jgi:LemA protein